MSPEGSPHKPQSECLPNAELEAELVSLSRDNYPDDTVGHHYFPELLEGRMRPATFADHGVWFAGAKTKQRMEALGVSSVSDLLHFPTADIESLPTRYRTLATKSIEATMTELERREALTPHGRLVSAIFGERQGPVRRSDEPALAVAVESALEYIGTSTHPRNLALFKRRFGLQDWRPLTLEETGAVFNVTRERVRQIEVQTVARLRHNKTAGRLEKFRTLPLRSLGRAVGLVYRRDIPALPFEGASLALGISEQASEAVRLENYNGTQGLSDLLSANLSYLSADVQTELANAVRQKLRTQEHHAVFGDLLPEVSVPYEVEDIIRSISLGIFALSSTAKMQLMQLHLLRQEITTLGSITDISRDPDSKPEGLSPAAIREIGSSALRLQAYLDAIAEI